MTKLVLTFCSFLIKVLLIICVSAEDQKDNHESTGLQLPLCEACNMVYKSFMDAMKLTTQSHFGGGDTSWEEAKLGPYATSEVRLIEIQELLCNSKRAKEQCQTLVEEWEQYLEAWWFKDRTQTPDLYEYLCVHSVKLCCLPGHYGHNCKPCPGFPNICSNNGMCEGNGTRIGSGQCSCSEGYEGELCDSCAIDYFKMDNDKTCQKCHISCQGGCTSFGPQYCNSCTIGWSYQVEHGCVDDDECIYLVCDKHEFCINTPGSYNCEKCDSTCESCSGPGPEDCVKCSSGLIREDNFCVKFDIVKAFLNNIRYVVYLVYCLPIIIIFKKCPFIAALLGVYLACYIMFKEDGVINPNVRYEL